MKIETVLTTLRAQRDELYRERNQLFDARVVSSNRK